MFSLRPSPSSLADGVVQYVSWVTSTSTWKGRPWTGESWTRDRRRKNGKIGTRITKDGSRITDHGSGVGSGCGCRCGFGSGVRQRLRLRVRVRRAWEGLATVSTREVSRSPHEPTPKRHGTGVRRGRAPAHAEVSAAMRTSPRRCRGASGCGCRFGHGTDAAAAASAPALRGRVSPHSQGTTLCRVAGQGTLTTSLPLARFSSM